MAQPFNLDEVDDSIDFMLNTKRYKLRLPTTEEVLGAEKLTSSEERLAFMYGLVDKVDQDAPDFKEALLKSNVLKQGKFNEMIATTLGM